MLIKEELGLVVSSDGAAQGVVVSIKYKTSESLPTCYAEGSTAYCYDGADKGKTKIFDGETWVEQS